MDGYEYLLEEAPCGILSVRDDGSIVYANATLRRLLRFDDLVGQHIDELLSPAARIFYQTHVYPLLKVHGEADEVYLSLRDREGVDIPTLINGLRRSRGGEAVLDFSIFVTTRRNQFESELLQARRIAEEALKARSRFLSVLSHDLRAPLAAIQMAADMLAAGAGGPTTDLQRTDLLRISSASSYVLSLVTDLLSFARVDANSVVLRVMQRPVALAIERAANIVEPLAHAAKIELDWTSVDASLTVLADPDRLQQILLNLLTNAIKFTPEEGRVSFDAVWSTTTVSFRVRDTGAGIAAESVATIFDPFVQLNDGEPGSASKGVGLGLAISRSLAREMRGDLTVESELGVGSTFTVTLPVV